MTPGGLGAQLVEELQKNNERYQDLIGLSTDWHWEQDAAFRFTFVSEGMRAYAYVDPATLIGKCRWELPTIGMTKPDWLAHRQTLEAHRPFRDFVYQIRDLQGAPRFVSISGKPVFDENGVFTGYRGIARDITANRQVEEALKRSNDRFRDMAALSSDWYWEQDAAFRFTAGSEWMQERPGVPPSYIGKRRWELPSQGVTEAQWQAHIDTLEAHQPFRNFEYCVRDQKGQLHYFSISGKPVFDADGKFTGYRGTGHDLTRQHLARERLYESQQMLQAVLNNIPLRVFWKDLHLNYLGCNGVFLKEAGLKTIADIVGKSDFDLWPQYAADARAVDEEVIGSNQSRINYETRVITAAGEEYWFRNSKIPLRDADGKVMGVLGILEDVTAHKLAEKAVRESEEQFRTTFEHAAVGIAHIGLDGRYIRLNQKYCEIVGYPAEELQAVPFQDITHPDDLAQNIDYRERLLDGAIATYSMHKRYIRKDGHVVWVNVTSNLRRDSETGAPKYFIAVIEDITERKKTEFALHDSERRFHSAFDNAPVGMALQALDGRYLQVNHAMSRITGYSAEALLSMSFREISHPDDIVEDTHRISELLAGKVDVYNREKRYIHKAGHIVEVLINATQIPDDDGHPLYVLVQIQDITARKESERRLTYLAQFDSLTGLPNRQLFHDRLALAMRRAARNGGQVSLLFLDMDKFKEINDTLGHAAGDQVLVRIAGLIKAALRETDTVARLSGDEFTVILEGLADQAAIAGVCKKILAAVSQPFMLQNKEYCLTGSMGIAVYPADAETEDGMLKAADLAMYQAKQMGRNRYQFFREELNAQALEAINLKNDLRLALERNELRLHYQPQVDILTGELFGVEALIRWQHPDLGLVPPGRFIPLAEDTGLIASIGAWALKAACLQLKVWQSFGLPMHKVAVNLSARQLKDSRLAAMIRATLDETGLSADSLEVEITEGMLIENIEQSRAILGELKAMGVHIALDDFGTGYSSLSYLKDLPLDVLKMDGAFIRHLDTNTRDAVIARTIIALAHSLDLDVIAECVETPEQMHQLRMNQCFYAQGYLFSRPLPPDELEALVQRDGLRAAVAGAAGPDEDYVGR